MWWLSGSHATPPDTAVVPPSIGSFSTTRTSAPPSCARVAAVSAAPPVDPLLALAAAGDLGRLHVQLLARTIREGWPVHFGSEAFSLDRWTDAVAVAVPEVPRPVLRARWDLTVRLILDVVGRVDVD